MKIAHIQERMVIFAVGKIIKQYTYIYGITMWHRRTSQRR